MALHVSVLEPKISKVLTFAMSRQKKCKSIFIFTFIFFVILKCYQTAIQYLGNVTLSLVVTSRYDKKLTRLGYHFVLRKVSALTGFWVHE